MSRIDQAIRESLLESYFYQEPYAEHLFLEDTALRNRYRQKEIDRKWFSNEATETRSYRLTDMDSFFLLEPNKHLYRIHLEKYMDTVQMYELQKMRTE